MRDADDAWPLVSGNRIDLVRGSLSEWFLNSEKGLRHGLDLPVGEDPGLVLFEFESAGALTPKIAEDGQSITLREAGGAPVLAYRELYAVDAEGRNVAARWERSRGAGDEAPGLRLVVDGAGHVPPIVLRGVIVASKKPLDSGDESGGGGGAQMGRDAEIGPLAVPTNDLCAGAEVIPASGPFPYLTSLVPDISGATTTGDPPTPSCQPIVSRSVWYSFTPSTSGNYNFSTCADEPTGTTVDDTVMAIYTSNGTCSGLSELAGGCDDDSCPVEAAQSVISGATLSAGTTYYIVAWKYDAPAPTAGNTAIQMQVSQVLGPGNDNCGAAIALSLDRSVAGTTANAIDDYELASGSPCFSGLGQTSSTAPGGDVVYRFTAPGRSSYSFRVTGYDQTKNAVLYVASDCPAGPSPATIAGCLGAANRNAGNPGEEVKCLDLGAGQAVYVYVDETFATAGSSFTIEVNECINESEPNGTPSAADNLVCGVEGSIMPGGDADFFALGIPEPSSRVFAMLDGVASNNTDYDLRVTTDTDTLEYDDANNDTPFGSLSGNVAGAPLNGAAAYLRVSHFSATLQAEPYRLYGVVQPPAAGATAEVEPNNTIATATSGSKLYFSGALSGTTDIDIFSFTASTGDLVYLGLDLDPTRDATPFNGTLALLDANGATLLMANDGGSTSSTAPGTGSLTLKTPTSPAEAIAYRAGMGGTYYTRVGYSSGTAGDYLLSIARNCRIGPPTDLAVTQTDSPDPVGPGGSVTYTIVVTNLGSGPATFITLRDDLPAGATLVSATPTQGSCTGSGPVFCQLGTLSGGAVATAQVVVAAPASPGTITNNARVTSMVIDPIPANDAASELTTVGIPDSDGDGVPDGADCAPNDPTAWTVPGEAANLRFPSIVDPTLMQWDPPPIPGGTTVFYDLLRSTVKNDFSAATCVMSNLTPTSASDPGAPPIVFYYLIRSENACGGNLGTYSDGTPRAGIPCP